jgi:hypothetical protein
MEPSPETSEPGSPREALRRRLEQDSNVEVWRFPDESELEALISKVVAVAEIDLLQPPAWLSGNDWPVHVEHRPGAAGAFVGREDLIDDLVRWWREPDPHDRLQVLYGVAGCGKTAVLERVLSRIEADAPRRGGVLCWSFDENPDVSEFVGAACKLFAGEAPGDPSVRRETLLRALRDGRPHRLLLDGFGHLRDSRGSPVLDLVVELLQDPGRSRILLASRTRSPLGDSPLLRGSSDESLGEWTATRSSSSLSPSDGRRLLQELGVVGTLAQHDHVVAELGGHALALEVAARHLARTSSDSTASLADFEAESPSVKEEPERRLAGIVHDFLARLDSPEDRELFSVLAIPRRGVLVGVLPDELRRDLDKTALLDSLERSDHVFREGESELERVVVRGFLRAPLLRAADDLWRARLRRHPIDVSSKRIPSAPRELEAAELALAFHLALDEVEPAVELFLQALGGFAHLGQQLGDYRRAWRFAAAFSTDGDPAGLRPDLDERARLAILWAWAQAASELGELELAERCFDLIEQTAGGAA